MNTMPQFRNLVFEGGGVKGIAYAGAIDVLERNTDFMPGIQRVAGTSAGAITAAILALGATSKDVERILGGTDFNDFMDNSWLIFQDLYRFLTKFGWYRGDAFGEWMKEQIHSLVGDKTLTFGQLRQMAAEDSKYKELTMVSSNLTLKLPQIFNADTTPDQEIWEAARMSMSIPLFFQAYRNGDNQVLIDGGVTWNYPIDIFDRKEYLSDPSNKSLTLKTETEHAKWEDQTYNKETLGFRVDSQNEIDAIERRKRMPPMEIHKLTDYFKAFLGFMYDMANKAHLRERDKDRTVFINSLGIKTAEFNLSEQDIQDLVQSGRDSTEHYLQWFNSASQNEALNKVTIEKMGT